MPTNQGIIDNHDPLYPMRERYGTSRTARKAPQVRSQGKMGDRRKLLKARHSHTHNTIANPRVYINYSSKDATSLSSGIINMLGGPRIPKFKNDPLMKLRHMRLRSNQLRSFFEGLSNLRLG